MRSFIRKTVCILSAGLIAVTGSSCGRTDAGGRPLQTGTKFLLDTSCTVSIYDKNDPKILDGAFSLCARYDRQLSMTSKGGDLYRINHAQGQPVTVAPDTVEVIREGLTYGEKSGGVFDITIGTLSALWNFDAKKPSVPDSSKISQAVRTVGYRDVVISGDTVTLKNPGTMIDLGAIAKGFIADKIKAYLVAAGVRKAVINLGGNVLTVGEKSARTPWVVGVQQPFESRNVDVGLLYVSDKSVVTSGIYERYFIENGTLYAHILDPRTGFPVENTLSSVTIISDRSVDGDGLSTTCFLLGLEKAEQLIRSLPGVEAIFITKDGGVVTASGRGGSVKFVRTNQNDG